MHIAGARKKIRVGDLLVEAGAITEDQLQQALEKQKEDGGRIGNVIMQMGFISKELLITVLTTQMGIEYCEVRSVQIDESVLKLVPDSLVAKYRAMPVCFDPDNPNILKVAMADPMDLTAVDDISISSGLQVEPMLSFDDDLGEVIGKYYGSAQAMEAAEAYKAENAALLGNEDDETQAEIDNSPIVLLVNQIIEGGVRQRASDIHIEALESKVRVRYRIDGALKEVMNYEIGIMPAITARIKIIGGMDIAEKRKPQDGRITIVVDRKEFDVRVSVLPTVFGEKTVMRLTSKDGLTKPKAGLGFSEEEIEVFDGILSNPHGIILVTGPTGSGKSTTLYTSLSELNKEEVNIITVEDPVEANINGINQVQVNVKAEMTFAAALRSILRQDPDIIMVGEMRDTETAEIAIRAAITGHLVLSTLHTNDAASTVTRLVDMGVEAYMVATSLIGIVAQRLTKTLCPECKKPRMSTPEEEKLMGIDHSVMIYDAGGCPKCKNTGYNGRTAIHEILLATPRMQVLITSGAKADEIAELAKEEGTLLLRDNVSKLVQSGVTSMDELVRVTYAV